jgi:hypothetical protein
MSWSSPGLDALFGAQLGATRDPRALVPGNPEAVVAAAEALAGQGTTMEQVGNGLGGVRTPSWSGTSSNAFWDYFSGERSRWHVGTDAMSGAAGALTQHAEVLRWAQGQAQQAIELWDQGVAATGAAQTQYATIAAQASAAGAPAPQFTDPGEATRQHAQEILTNARQQLDQAGVQTAQTLGTHAGEDGAPDWLAAAARVAQTAVQQDDDGEIEIRPIEGEIAIKWEKEAEANLWKWDPEKREGQLGPVELEGDAEVAVGGLAGTAGLTVSNEGISGELGGKAYVLNANAEGSAALGDVTAKGSVSAFAGAAGGGNLQIGQDGVSAAGEAFVGGRVGGQAEVVDVGGLSGQVKGEVWAGAGVKGNLDIGRGEDGAWVFRGELGAALGIGGSVGFGLSINPGSVADTVSEAADTVGNMAESVGDWIGF